MATKTEDQEVKKVSKLDSVLNKIDAFFEGLMSAKKPDDDMDDDDKKADDDDADAKKAKGKKADDEEMSAKTKKAKKATDDDDDQDDDDDDDFDDEDKKDSKKKDAEIKKLKALVAQQNELLTEAKAELAQTDEEVRETIKSTFTPNGSKRSAKSATVGGSTPSWATPTTDIGKRAAKLASQTKGK